MLRLLRTLLEKFFGVDIYHAKRYPFGINLYFDLSQLVPPTETRLVLDVGGNSGQSALHYVQKFPAATIYSFEPVAFLFAELQAATAAHPRILPQRLALGREPGRAQIHVTRFSSSMHSNFEQPTEEIQIDSLSHFCERQELGTIDFMKVDVEGHELEVLAGAASLLQKQRIRVVYLECGSVRRPTDSLVPFGRLAEFLYTFGYELFGIYDQQPYFSFDGRRSLLYFNAAFICPDLVGQKRS